MIRWSKTTYYRGYDMKTQAVKKMLQCSRRNTQGTSSL